MQKDGGEGRMTLIKKEISLAGWKKGQKYFFRRKIRESVHWQKKRIGGRKKR